MLADWQYRSLNAGGTNFTEAASANFLHVQLLHRPEPVHCSELLHGEGRRYVLGGH